MFSAIVLLALSSPAQCPNGVCAASGQTYSSSSRVSVRQSATATGHPVRRVAAAIIHPFRRARSGGRGG